MENIGRTGAALVMSLAAGVLLMSCQPQKSSDTSLNEQKGPGSMKIEKQSFGRLPDGTEVDIFTLTNSHGLSARLMTLGATLVSLHVPDREAQLADIVLGHDSLDGYLESSPYFGCIVGRYGNRIAEGAFTLDEKKYTLAVNNGAHHLHGGLKGFDKVIWNAEPVKKPDSVGIRFIYLSPDGEEGYPGNLACTVVYTLTEKNELCLEYRAETDKPTPVNLTHHSYFNLTGQGGRPVLDHELTINADRFTPVDEGLIPTGEIRDVEGTPWDFRNPKPIGRDIGRVKGGYDHNYVLNRENSELSLAARVHEPSSGRVMEIWTTEPGVQFYSGNFLDGTISGKSEQIYGIHSGFCLETQHFPDSPNQPGFPSTILRPGDTYSSTTCHRFFTR